jgi:excinuclease UvrABC nuclease subunit
MGKLSYAGTDTQWLKKLDNLQIGKSVYIPKGEKTKNEKDSEYNYHNLENIISTIFEKSIRKISKSLKNADYLAGFKCYKSEIQSIFQKELNKELNQLKELSKTEEKYISKIRKLEYEFEGKRAALRNKLASELRSARGKLWKLERQLPFEETIEGRRKMFEFHEKIRKERGHARQKLANELVRGREKLKSLRNYLDQEVLLFANKNKIEIKWEKGEYPPPPNPIFKADQNGIGLPQSSGIYFIWENEEIIYVGKSINLSNRVRFGSHHVLEENNLVSYVLIPKDQLTWAECHYIAMARPKKNKTTPF